MNIDQLIQTIAIAAIPILFAITLHEAAHGYVARYFGDMTADRAGASALIRSTMSTWWAPFCCRC